MNRRTMMMPKVEGQLLPSEYQRVSWIGRAADSGAYINTNLFSTEKTKIEATISLDATTTSNILGNYYTGFGNADGKLRILRGSGVYNTSILAPVGVLLNTVIETDNGKLIFAVNGEVEETSIGNTAYKRILLMVATSPWGDSPLNNTFVGKFYGETKVEINSVLTGNFIPCYRKSDGVIGMFDSVSQSFFVNAGTGTFTKGDDVN